MAKGKFSSPRPYREEEREIEKAYRQVTEKAASPWRRKKLEDTAELPVIPQPPQVPQEPQPPIEEALPVQEIHAPDLPPQRPAQRELFPEIPEEDWSDEEDEGPDEDDTFLDRFLGWCRKAGAFFSENKKIALAGLCAIALIVIVTVLTIFLSLTADPYDNQILRNVYVAGVNVGGMTKKDAVSAVKKAADSAYAQEDMILDLDGTEYSLSTREISPRLDASAAVNAAYDYGRKGTNAEQEEAFQSSLTEAYYVPLGRFLTLNKNYIRTTLESLAQDSGSTLTQTTYALEGTQPPLATNEYNALIPCQTLVIQLGTPGTGFDPNSVYDQVMDAYDSFSFRVTVEDLQSSKDPDPLDLEAVYREFYIAPVDASVDPKTNKPTPGSYGYGFDLEAGLDLLKNAQFGQELRIPMEYIEPSVLEGNLLYLDTLGQHQTTAIEGKNRNTNLAVACGALDGVVIEPGKTFSFQETVGKLTEARGYKYAYADEGEQYRETLGGGINQVASTLYYAALLSDLAIVDRESQTYPASYIEYGFDAEVQMESNDLRFKNTTDYPIKLEAKFEYGEVKIRILGTDQRTHYVKLESRIENTYAYGTEYLELDGPDEEYADGEVIRKGISGFRVKTYKLTYDDTTNELLSRVEESTSRYQPVDELVAKYKEEPTHPTEAETEPEEEPEWTESDESTQAPDDSSDDWEEDGGDSEEAQEDLEDSPEEGSDFE